METPVNVLVVTALPQRKLEFLVIMLAKIVVSPVVVLIASVRTSEPKNAAVKATISVNIIENTVFVK